MKDEIAGAIDLENVVGADEESGRLLLDQNRAVKTVSRTQGIAGEDIDIGPTPVRIEKDGTPLDRLRRPGCRRSAGRLQGWQQPDGDDAKLGNLDHAAGLEVAVQAFVFGFEGVADGRRIKPRSGVAEADAHIILLAAVSEVHFQHQMGLVFVESLGHEGRLPIRRQIRKSRVDV